MNPHALLITGQLRCVDDNLLAFLDTTNELANIFIITDKAFKDEANRLNERYGCEVYFTEDASDDDIGIARESLHMLHPEHIKLEIALKRMIDWEDRNHHRFSFVHRFRTDISYQGSFQDYISPLEANTENSRDIMFATWCTNHSGNRASMIKLLGHPEFCVRYKTSFEFFESVHASIDIKALRTSSHPGLFMASLPVAILNNRAYLPNFHGNIMTERPLFVDAAEDFARRVRVEGMPDIVKTLHSKISTNSVKPIEFNILRSYSNQWFPWFPEHIFFVYINFAGMSTSLYSFKSDNRRMPLKTERHATTALTKEIFRMIENKDYSFLDKKLSWEKEIEDFLSTGGQSSFFAAKLSKMIDVNLLSDSACARLYDIIDIINQPSWIVSFAPQFMNSVAARGIAPPATLKAFLEEN